MEWQDEFMKLDTMIRDRNHQLAAQAEEIAGLIADLVAERERLGEAEGLVAGLLKMADDAMAAWGIAALHGVGLVDEKTAQEKENLKDSARAFLSPTPAEPAEMVMVRRDDLEITTSCLEEWRRSKMLNSKRVSAANDRLKSALTPADSDKEN